jgi:hypothetical protein
VESGGKWWKVVESGGKGVNLAIDLPFYRKSGDLPPMNHQAICRRCLDHSKLVEQRWKNKN